MRKKVRRSLALLLALTMMVTLVKSEELFVSAENVSLSEDVFSDTEKSVMEEEAKTVPDETEIDGETEAGSEETTKEEPEEEIVKAGGELSGEEVVLEEIPETPEEEPEEIMDILEEETDLEEKNPEPEFLEEGIPEDKTLEEDAQKEEEKEEAQKEEMQKEEAAEEAVEEAVEEHEEDQQEVKTREYFPDKQPQGISVKAYVAEGILPENVHMVVTALSDEDETSGQYGEAAEALENSGVDYDGFVALDISFQDEDGKEIEPEDGAVQVKFELDTDVLPEEADVQTLSVQHLAETENGLDVQTVADSMEINEEAAVVAAEFEVESFSSFTITWKNTTGTFDSADQEITVNYVKSDGTELFVSDVVNEKISAHDEVTLSDYDVEIEGYRYVGARQGSVNGPEVQKIRVYKTNGWFGSSAYTLQGTEDGTTWKSLVSDNICLVYEQEEDIPDIPVISKKLSHEKYVELKSDDTYDLNLTVSGAVGSVSEKAKVDVIFVLDISTSMNRRMNNDNQASGNQERIDYASGAVRTMTNSLSGNEKIDARYSLVTFGTTASLRRNWTSNASVLNNDLPNSVEIGQGTNYEDGLLKAKELLTSSRSGAATVVVFISDGDPSYYNKNGGGVGGPGGSYSETAMAQAQAVVATMDTNYFFTVGVGPVKNYSKLEYLTNPQKAGSPSNVRLPEGMITKNYAGTDSESLNTAFADMEGILTFLLCKNVVITDNLSENVQLVTKESGEPEKLVVSVKDDEGNVIYGPGSSIDIPKTDRNRAVTLAVSYDSEAKQIKLKFPEDYQLEAGWTYVITANIDATEKAYENYRNNYNSYPNTGEQGTGVTSDGKKGVFSNASAKVDYSFDGEEKSEGYSNPVIQLHPGSLMIEKTIVGLEDAEALQTLAENLNFRVGLNSGTEQIVQFTDFSDEGNGKFTYSVDGLSPNTTYTVSEHNQDVESYICTTASANLSGSIGKDEQKKASFTNTYKKATNDLVITKAISMEGTEDISSAFGLEFVFTVTSDKQIPNGAYKVNYSEGADPEKGTETVEFINGSAEITIKGAGSVTIKSLPLGTYTVTEKTPVQAPENYYFDGEQTELTGQSVLTVDAAGEVTITNHYSKYRTVTVIKKVRGNMGDQKGKFAFTAAAGEGAFITASSGTILEKDDGTYSFELGHNDSITLTGLRKGDSLEIEEINYSSEGYSTSVQVDDGDIVSGRSWSTAASTGIQDDVTVTFTNKKEVDPPTGIFYDTFPYMILLVISVVGILTFFVGRRRRV